MAGGTEMAEKLKVKCVGRIPPHEPGDIVEIDVDEHGTALDFHWHRRLRYGDAVPADTTSKDAKPKSKPEGK